MKTVLMTGATSGFGLLATQMFLQKGHRVIATGRTLTRRSHLLQKEREQYGDRLIEMDFDVTNAEERKALLHKIQEYKIDVLVNNAGYGAFGPLEEASDETIRRQFEVNFFGLTFLCRDLLPHLRETQGRIVNISSCFGFIGFPLTSLYCASKYAVEGLSESLFYEMSPHGVGVSLIEPGGFRTSFNQNAEWTESKSHNSIYSRQIENFKKMRDKLMARPNPPDPQLVVDAIYTAAIATKPKLRYTVGRDAVSAKVSKKLLPGRIFISLTNRIYKRAFFKELS